MRKDLRGRFSITGKRAPRRIKWQGGECLKSKRGTDMFPLYIIGKLDTETCKISLVWFGGQVAYTKAGIVIPGFKQLNIDPKLLIVYRVFSERGKQQELAESLMDQISETLTEASSSNWYAPVGTNKGELGIRPLLEG